MGLTNSVNVRLPEDLRERLNRMAKRSGLAASDLVRLATERYVDEAERTGKLDLVLRDETALYRAVSKK